MFSFLKKKPKAEPSPKVEAKPVAEPVLEPESTDSICIELSYDPNHTPKPKKKAPEPPNIDMSAYADLSEDAQTRVKDLLTKAVYHEHPEVSPMWFDKGDFLIENAKSIVMADLCKFDAAKLVYSETGDIGRCIRDVEAIWSQDRGCGLCSRDRFYLVDLYAKAGRIDDAMDLLDVIVEEAPRDAKRVENKRAEIRRNAGLLG